MSEIQDAIVFAERIMGEIDGRFREVIIEIGNPVFSTSN
jgi:hypothetical protein